MKNFLQGVVFLVSCLFATFVVAQTAPEAPVRLFVTSTSPEQWANTMALYKEHKVMVDDEILVDQVIPIAYGTAQRTNHSSGQLTPEAFAKAWSQSNPALPLGGKVKAEVFQNLAQAKDGGIYLPRSAPVAQAGVGPVPAPTSAPATPVAAAVASGPTLPAMVDAKQAIAIVALEAQVKSLQQTVAKVGDGQKETADLKSQLATLGKQLTTLKKAQSGFAQKADIDQAVRDLEGLRSAVNQLTIGLDGFKTNQDGLSLRVDTLEASPFVAWWKELLTVLAAVMLLCIGVAIALWKKTTKVKLVADNAVKTANEATGTAGAAEKTANQAAKDVSVLQDQIHNLDPTIPDNLELQLRTLAEGDEYLASVTVEDKAVMLRFTRSGAGVKIEGITSQSVNNVVLFENVRKRIKKAAWARDLIGLEDEVSGLGREPLRAVG